MLNSLVQMRYANNSNYKNDDIITRQVYVSKAVLEEFKRIVSDSEVRLVHTFSHCILRLISSLRGIHLLQGTLLLYQKVVKE